MHHASGIERTPFRNEQVAAPLKETQDGLAPQRHGNIPQRTSCGPIEGG